MVVIKKSNSNVNSQSLKQSKLLFASNKRSNSGQSSAKGKKPPVRTGSAPVTQQSKRQSPTSDNSASSDEEEVPSKVKRRKSDEKTNTVHRQEVGDDGMVKERPKLRHDDRKWSKIFNEASQKMGSLSPGELLLSPLLHGSPKRIRLSSTRRWSDEGEPYPSGIRPVSSSSFQRIRACQPSFADHTSMAHVSA
jgi:hypothetical protein